MALLCNKKNQNSKYEEMHQVSLWAKVNNLFCQFIYNCIHTSSQFVVLNCEPPGKRPSFPNILKIVTLEIVSDSRYFVLVLVLVMAAFPMNIAPLFNKKNEEMILLLPKGTLIGWFLRNLEEKIGSFSALFTIESSMDWSSRSICSIWSKNIGLLINMQLFWGI